jgi:hypothetical protein
MSVIYIEAGRSLWGVRRGKLRRRGVSLNQGHEARACHIVGASSGTFSSST